jgi:hypothetical protein
LALFILYSLRERERESLILIMEHKELFCLTKTQRKGEYKPGVLHDVEKLCDGMGVGSLLFI